MFVSSLPLQQGVEQVQHHGAVLATIEGYAQLLKPAVRAKVVRPNFTTTTCHY
jgi:hypothetical protein